MPWRYQTAALNIGALESNVANAMTTATSTATALANLLAGEDTDTSGGISVAEDFTGYTGGAGFGSDWTQESGSETYTGIYEPTGSGFDTSYGIFNPIAWFITDIPGGFGASETFYVRHNTVMTTDSVEITVVIGSEVTEAVSLHIFSHGASNLADIIRVSLRDNRFWWGPAQYSAGSWSYDDWNSGGTAVTVPNGATIKLRNQGTQWTLTINGVTVGSFTDSGGDAFYDASHRYWGFILDTTNQFIANTGHCMGLSSITASDVAIPTYRGRGFRLYRTSTSGTSGLSSGATNQAMPSGTFDTSSAYTNCDVESLGLGEIEIPVAGRWGFVIAFKLNNALGTTAHMRANLGRRPTSGGALSWLQEGGEHSANADQVSSGFYEYYEEGEIAVPGYAGNSIGNDIRGEAAGIKTYFEGVLLPRSLNG